MRVTFLRHGKALKAEVNHSDLSRQLSDIGKQQAIDRRRKLNGATFDLVISSPADRAVDTGAIIANRLNKDSIIILPELYPDPNDGSVGTAIDTLFNLPHLGYCEVAKYLKEPDGDVVTRWGHDTWSLVDGELMTVADKANVAVFGHAVCLPAIGMAACESNPALVEQISQINLGECEGFTVVFDHHTPIAVEPIND